MKKNVIFVDDANKRLVVSKAFYKNASVFGSAEYYALRKAKKENAEYSVVFQSVLSDKKTYHGLSLSRMADYIQTQPNANERMAEFEAVKKIAKAKGSLYPLTKKWFLQTYPHYKENDVSSEVAKSTPNAQSEATKEAEAKKETIPSSSKESENTVLKLVS